MSVTGIQEYSTYDSYSSLNGAGSASSTKQTGSDGMQLFLAYASETPAQRLFTGWLGSQGMTMDEYNSLSDSQKEKLIEKFREQLEKEFGGGDTSALSSQLSAVGV